MLIFTFHFLCLGYNEYIYGKNTKMIVGGYEAMHTFFVILVLIAFLTAILTSGYNDKPNANK